MDKIRNERIRGTMKVVEVSQKIQERRLQWFGHVKSREEEYVGRRVMEMKVRGRRKRGTPNHRWMDCVREDLREKQLTENHVYGRARWRKAVQNIHPTYMWEKMYRERRRVYRYTRYIY